MSIFIRPRTWKIPLTQEEIEYLYYERKSSEGEPTQDISKSPYSRGRRGFKTNLVLPPKFTKDGTEA